MGALGLRIKSIIFLTLLIATKLQAQETGNIKGKIVEQITKQPIAGATVTLKEKQVSVITDSSGIYIFSNIPPGSYSITISYVGFQEKRLNEITILRAKTNYIETELLENNENLGEVVVKAFKGENNPMVPVSSYSFSRDWGGAPAKPARACSAEERILGFCN